MNATKNIPRLRLSNTYYVIVPSWMIQKAFMSESVKPHHLLSEPETPRKILTTKFKDLDLQEHDLIEEEECEAPVEGSQNVGISHV